MRLFIFSLSVLLLLSACNRNNSSQTTSQTSQVGSSFAAGSPEARGEALFVGKGRCSSCHSLAEGTRIVGPSLAHIATIAETRVAGFNAEAYLIQSVLQPDAFKPKGYETTQMDTSLAKSLTSEELNDIVAYMLTLE